MARPEMPGSGSEQAIQNEIARHKDLAEAGLMAAEADDSDAPTRRYLRAGAAERDRRVQELRNTDFPAAMRGYDRGAVDRYVTQVNRLIAELEIASSPESAVRHALQEVSEETRDLLQRAHQTAEDIAARSRAKADDRLDRAEREADDVRSSAEREAAEIRAHAEREAERLRESAERDAAQLRETTTGEMTQLRETTMRDTQQLQASAQREAAELRTSAQRETDEMRGAAEARVRELSQNAETIWRERRRLIEDMRAVGEQLVAIGEAEARRFPRFGNGGPPEREPAPEESVAT